MPLHAVLLDLDRTLFDKDSALRNFAHTQFVEHVEAVRPLWRDEWLQRFCELLARLRDAGLQTAIVSNGRDAFQRAKIAALGATRLVDAIVTSGAFGLKKPDPAIFGEALPQLDPAADFASDSLQRIGDFLLEAAASTAPAATARPGAQP